MRGACFSVLFATLVPACGEMHSSTEGCHGGTSERTDVRLAQRFEVEQALADGVITIDDCDDLCHPEQFGDSAVLDCQLTDSVVGDEREVECTVQHQDVCEGRHHASLRRRPHGAGPSELAAWLQRAAHAETASVLAFLELRRELRAHGAPESWLRRCTSAAADEVDHARRLRQLAALHGARAPRLSFHPRQPVRPLLAIAVENAVEGAVYETFAGVLARHQAVHAEDPRVSAAFAAIAPDEQRHAELAWDLHRWLMAELPRAERSIVERALRVALTRLGEPPTLGPQARRQLGLPAGSERKRLARGLVNALSSLS